jgi:hypothetical protein
MSVEEWGQQQFNQIIAVVTWRSPPKEFKMIGYEHHIVRVFFFFILHIHSQKRTKSFVRGYTGGTEENPLRRYLG